MKEKNAEYFIIPFNSKKMGDQYLVTNRLGGWMFQDRETFARFNTLKVDPKGDMFSQLKARGLVADVSNIQELLQGFRRMNSHLFLDTALHIAVVTTRCNQACSYCQARPENAEDMTTEVAARVVKYLFDVRQNSVVLELQGGEPLMNWPVASYLIALARKVSAGGKKLKIALVSNLLLLDESKMKFLAENEVDVCTSLDGPPDIHDQNRRRIGGHGTYRDVTARVALFKDKFGRRVGMLPTITRASLKHARRIVDEYVHQGQEEICLRPVNNMGSANCSWSELGYSAEEFMDFYREATDYVFELNKQGVHLSERMTRLIATKVLLKKDPGYVDMMNPCGAGRATMTYMPDGGCYPCDEARMVGGDIFKLGNILTDEYKDVTASGNLLSLLQASCTELWTHGSVFSPWNGYCPVVNYAVQKNVVLKAACSQAQRIQDGQFEYVFSKLAGAGKDADIVLNWARGGGDEK